MPPGTLRRRCIINEYGTFYEGCNLHGIRTTGDLTVTGSGSLTVENGEYTGIDCGGNLRLDSASPEFRRTSDSSGTSYDIIGFLDGSNIEINDCELNGFYLWSKNDIALKNTKLDTNGQSIIFGSSLTAEKCDITV